MTSPLPPLVTALEGTLIVSCQAYPSEPLRDPRTMAQVAAAVAQGGASAVRAQGPEDIRQVKAAVDVPVIGIWKDGDRGVFITPTLDHALAVIDAGADILALDATDRPRPDGRTLEDTVQQIRTRWDGPLMADCDSADSARHAAALGIEIIGTTLAGYTPARARTTGPDLALLTELADTLPATSMLVAEGRIHTPDQAAAAKNAGAHAVVVGTAITHPPSITRWFHDAVTGA